MKKLQLLVALFFATFIFGSAQAGEIFQAKEYTGEPIVYSGVPKAIGKNNDNKFQGAVIDNAIITWLTGDVMTTSFGGANGSFYMPLMQLQPEDFISFKDQFKNITKINAIQFAIGNDFVSAVTELKVVILKGSSNLSEAYSQDATPVAGWNTVQLDVPFEIPEGETIWVGYQFKQAGSNVFPIGMTTASGKMIEKQSYVGMSDGSIKKLNELNAQFANYNLLTKVIGTAEVTTEANYNITLEEVSVNPKYILANTETSVVYSCTVRNIGAETINSLDISMKIGNETKTAKISDISIPYTQAFSFSINDQINLSEVGNTPIEISITKLNEDFDDEDLSNNTKLSNIIVASFWPQKKYLGEEATGTWCPWCTRGMVFMDSMAIKYPNDWIGVAVHNNDPMQVSGYGNIITSILGTGGFPSGSIDRAVSGDPSYFPAYMELLKNNSAFKDYTFGVADLDITNFKWNETTREVSFDAEAKFAINNAENKKYRLLGIITEDSVTGTTSEYAQANAYAGGTNGKMGGFENKPNPIPASDMVYNEVARAVLGSPYGIDGSLPANIDVNSTHTYSFSYTVSKDWNYENLHFIVALLADGEKIFNAVKKEAQTSIKEEISSINSIYPNPTKGNLTIDLKENAKVTIFGLEGNKLFEENREEGFSDIKLNVTSGTYILRTETNKGSSSTKFVVE